MSLRDGAEQWMYKLITILVALIPIILFLRTVFFSNVRRQRL